MCTPIKIDCKNLRVIRQQDNNDIIFRALITTDEKLVRYHCNNNELERVLDELNKYSPITLEELLNKCANDHYAITLAGRISKIASRQRINDEKNILNKCNETLNQVGIEILKLTTNSFRPSKDKRTLTNKDARISGKKKNGYLLKSPSR